MKQKFKDGSLDFAVFLIVSVLFFGLVYLYIKYVDVVKTIYNFILMSSVILYAFFCERVFRKRFATRHIVYPVIVLIVYFLFLLLVFSTPWIKFDSINLKLVIIYSLTIMVFALPIAVLFDFVSDIRFVKRANQKKTGNMWIDRENLNRGIFLKNAKLEDLIIFMLAVAVVWLIIFIFQ